MPVSVSPRLADYPPSRIEPVQAALPELGQALALRVLRALIEVPD
jgi:hypothetical protein